MSAPVIDLSPRHHHRAWWRRLYARHEATILATTVGALIVSLVFALSFALLGGWRWPK